MSGGVFERLALSFVQDLEGRMALAKPDETENPAKSRALSILGPGLITGASDDDPSGIATYSQVGAQFGFSISWTMLFSYPLMAAIQEISGRIGRTTGRGIAGNIRRHYPAWLLHAIVRRGGTVLVSCWLEHNIFVRSIVLIPGTETTNQS